MRTCSGLRAVCEIICSVERRRGVEPETDRQTAMNADLGSTPKIDPFWKASLPAQLVGFAQPGRTRELSVDL